MQSGNIASAMQAEAAGFDPEDKYDPLLHGEAADSKVINHMEFCARTSVLG